ncbi:MAG: hypothetical protein J5833_03105 [Victivallales bacterium]|nr:hypothetical protein [Victivallales bacterium]
MKRPIHIRKTILFASLAVAVVLAGYPSCARRLRAASGAAGAPRFTMSQLDAKARPHIRQAEAAIPDVTARLCSHKCRLFWLIAKDRCTGSSEARRHIAEAIEPTIIVPLRKAAAIYKCAVNADAAVGMTADAAIDNLSSRLYATAGLAIEAVFIRATLQSCAKVMASCAPRLAASWSQAGVCAMADGPFPIGDAIGAALVVGGTIWCAADLHRASKALPAEISTALRSAVAATVAQCRMEAASAL